MTPEEVQAYVEEKTGANAKDPFEGMDPTEIDAYVKQHGLQPTQWRRPRDEIEKMNEESNLDYFFKLVWVKCLRSRGMWNRYST